MFRLVRDVCERYGRHTSQDAVILDYGCGWGRIIRFFLTVYDNRNVYGVDVDPDMVEYCQSLIGTGRYAPTSGRPPLDFEDGSIDSSLWTYGGNTNINAGILQVDGSIASPNTFVASGAALQGIGIIRGNVSNSGNVAPGGYTPRNRWV